MKMTREWLDLTDSLSPMNRTQGPPPRAILFYAWKCLISLYAAHMMNTKGWFFFLSFLILMKHFMPCETQQLFEIQNLFIIRMEIPETVLE